MRRKNNTSFLDNIWVLPLLVIFLVLFVVGVVNMYGKNKKTHEARQEIEEELGELEEKYTNLEDKLEKLSTERGVEEELRDQYHVVEPGEEQIVIIENEPENIDTDNEGWLADLFH